MIDKHIKLEQATLWLTQLLINLRSTALPNLLSGELEIKSNHLGIINESV